MSITKLKTVGNWQLARWQDDAAVAVQGNIRGRIITGMLTGDDAGSDGVAVAQDPRTERTG